ESHGKRIKIHESFLPCPEREKVATRLNPCWAAQRQAPIDAGQVKRFAASSPRTREGSMRFRWKSLLFVLSAGLGIALLAWLVLPREPPPALIEPDHVLSEADGGRILSLSGDGRRLACVHGDSRVLVWDWLRHKQLASFLAPAKAEVLAWSGDG